jgi:hypothetical protein
VEGAFPPPRATPRSRVHGIAFGEELTIDAVEWIWILSGRGTGTGLLEKALLL